jgi:hypothetical protein
MASYVYAARVVHFKLGFFKETARPDYIGLRVVSLDRPWCTGDNAIWCHGSCYLMGRWIHCVRRRPGQNRVTWKPPSSRAFVPLQEPVGVLASYVPHAQMQV